MWTFKHRNLIHCNHVFQANPFLYPEHAALHPGNHKALAEATKHRNQKSTYRQHLRAQDPKARLLSESEYYNIGYQRQTVNQNQPEVTLLSV